MKDVRDSGRFDWLIELAGATAPAAAAGFAALKLAPGWTLAAVLAAFAPAYLVMRLVRPEPRPHRLPAFELDAVEFPPQLAELLLDQVHVEESEILLLEDALPSPPSDSRVIRLFAVDSMPTAGELKNRIDRHLATAPRPVVQQIPDASDALFEALADLRRSLR